MHALRAQQLTSAFIISTFIKTNNNLLVFARAPAERQQERSIRAGDGRAVHSFASAATLPVPEHRADSHDLHRAGSSALQFALIEWGRHSSRANAPLLLVDALASSAGAAPARPRLTLRFNSGIS